MTLIHYILQHALIPAIKEISVVSIPRGVSVGKDEGLVRVERFRAVGCPVAGGPVELWVSEGVSVGVGWDGREGGWRVDGQSLPRGRFVVK